MKLQRQNLMFSTQSFLMFFLFLLSLSLSLNFVSFLSTPFLFNILYFTCFVDIQMPVVRGLTLNQPVMECYEPNTLPARHAHDAGRIMPTPFSTPTSTPYRNWRICYCLRRPKTRTSVRWSVFSIKKTDTIIAEW